MTSGQTERQGKSQDHEQSSRQSNYTDKHKERGYYRESSNDVLSQHHHKQNYKSGTLMRRNEHRGASERNTGPSREYQRSTSSGETLGRYHSRSTNHRQKSQQDTSDGFVELDLMHSSIMWFSDSEHVSTNRHHDSSQATKNARSQPVVHQRGCSTSPSPRSVQASTFNFDHRQVRDYQTDSRVTQEQAALGQRNESLSNLQTKRNNGHSQQSNSPKMDSYERSGKNRETGHQEGGQADFEPPRRQQRPAGNGGSNASLTSGMLETKRSFDAIVSDRNSRKGRPRKFAKPLNSLGEFRHLKTEDHPKTSQEGTGASVESGFTRSKTSQAEEMTELQTNSSSLSKRGSKTSSRIEQESDVRRKVELRSSSPRDASALYQCQTSSDTLQKDKSVALKKTNDTGMPVSLSTSSQKEQLETLRVMLGVKKEPDTGREVGHLK